MLTLIRSHTDSKCIQSRDNSGPSAVRCANAQAKVAYHSLRKSHYTLLPFRSWNHWNVSKCVTWSIDLDIEPWTFKLTSFEITWWCCGFKQSLESLRHSLKSSDPTFSSKSYPFTDIVFKHLMNRFFLLDFNMFNPSNLLLYIQRYNQRVIYAIKMTQNRTVSYKQTLEYPFDKSWIKQPEGKRYDREWGINWGSS